MRQDRLRREVSLLRMDRMYGAETIVDENLRQEKRHKSDHRWSRNKDDVGLEMCKL